MILHRMTEFARSARAAWDALKRLKKFNEMLAGQEKRCDRIREDLKLVADSIMPRLRALEEFDTVHCIESILKNDDIRKVSSASAVHSLTKKIKEICDRLDKSDELSNTLAHSQEQQREAISSLETHVDAITTLYAQMPKSV